MAKRRSENGQMRREDYEAAEGDDVSADSFSIGFERASEASIRQRKIVKARVGSARPTPVAAPPKPQTGNASAAAAPTAGANPFGGFQGLTAAPAAGANPFAGFSGLTGASTAASTASTTSTPAPPASTSTAKPASTTGKTYQEAIETLNKEFLAFVNSQAKENPSVSWVAAVQDYLKYASAIADKHAATKPVPFAQQAKQPAPAPFSFASTATNGSSPAAPAKETASSPAPFSFGVAKKAEPKSDAKDAEPAKPAPASRFTGFSFGSTSSTSTEEKTIPAFSFGAKPSFAAPATGTDASAKPLSTSGFSFGAMPTSVASPLPPVSKPFSFGAAAGSSSTSAGAGANEEEDEENIGREAATVILKDAASEEDDCTFEAEKAKVLEFKKDEKRWADKGVHPLQVLVNKETKSARILVRNQIGKIVLNAALYKGISLKPHEAKGKKTGVLLSLQVDGALTQFILKVNAAKVDEFIAALDKAANGS